MKNWCRPRTKQYRGITVDAELDTNILDLLNSNPKIRIRSVCAGHDTPTEPDQIYEGNIPLVVFSPVNGNGRVMCEQLKKSVKAPIECTYDERYNLVEVKGTERGTLAWWKAVAEGVGSL
jgi:hypothetical protein